MKISLRKSCSTLLIFSMLLSVLAISGCKKKQEGSVSDLPEEITADMEWYEASSTAIETNINEAEFEYVTTDVLGCIGDKVIFSKYAGTEVKFNGEEVMILSQTGRMKQVILPEQLYHLLNMQVGLPQIHHMTI